MVSRNCQTLVTTALLSTTISLPLPVRAANVGFEQIFVFGNSISDTGNVLSISSAINNPFPPSPLFFQGRFSDGLVWTDYLSQELDLNLINFYSDNVKNTDSSINFAIGGATTGTTSLGGSAFPGVATQVDDFIDFLYGTEVDEDALVILWTGENDYVENFINQGTVLNPEVSVNDISDALTKLANSGAKHILVSNLPNLGDIPLGHSLGSPEDLNMLTALHNSLLNSELESLSTSFPETNLVLFDSNSVLKEIFNNPTDFGLNANPLESCLSPNNFPDIDPNVTRCDNPNEFFYYDNQHFTSQVHRFIADAALETIKEEFYEPNSEPKPIPESRNTVGLIALGIGLLLQLSKRKR